MSTHGACPRVHNSAKPVLFVLNKHANEWGGPPVNYIPMDALTPLVNDFHVVYHRPDRNAPVERNRQTFRRWPAEIDWLRSHDIQILPYTDLRTQICYMYQADAFVSSQGGASRLAAVFRKPLVVWHMLGSDNYTNIRAFSANRNVFVTRRVKDVCKLLRHRFYNITCEKNE